MDFVYLVFSETALEDLNPPRNASKLEGSSDPLDLPFLGRSKTDLEETVKESGVQEVPM